MSCTIKNSRRNKYVTRSQYSRIQSRYTKRLCFFNMDWNLTFYYRFNKSRKVFFRTSITTTKFSITENSTIHYLVKMLLLIYRSYKNEFYYIDTCLLTYIMLNKDSLSIIFSWQNRSWHLHMFVICIWWTYFC